MSWDSSSTRCDSPKVWVGAYTETWPWDDLWGGSGCYSVEEAEALHCLRYPDDCSGVVLPPISPPTNGGTTYEPLKKDKGPPIPLIIGGVALLYLMGIL